MVDTFAFSADICASVAPKRFQRVTSVEVYSLLIADDDSALRQALRDVFEPRGFRTLLAANGREAIDLIEANDIHCLLLDMHMPDLTGLEILQIVRPRWAQLPAIMLTADHSKRILQEAVALRAFTVLRKPVSRELVTDTVQRALRRAFPA